MFKPFFYHYNKGPGKLPNDTPRGFTVHFKPMDMSQRHVWMSIAWCSPKDEFNKKIARQVAQSKDYKLVHIRDVPGLVAGALESVDHYQADPSDFFWLYKYFF